MKQNAEGILRELEVLPGFIIGSHNLNDIRYADGTLLIADTEKCLFKPLRISGFLTLLGVISYETKC